MRESISYLSIDSEQINGYMDKWFSLKVSLWLFRESLLKKTGSFFQKVICLQIAMALLCVVS